MSCVVEIFMVRAKKRKAVMVGGDAVVRGEWWFISSWVELCTICKMWMSSVRV